MGKVNIRWCGAEPAVEPVRVNEQHVEEEPRFRIRARHTDATVTVYQAYRPAIGRPAAHTGRFPSTWKRDRMTWIKPRS